MMPQPHGHHHPPRQGGAVVPGGPAGRGGARMGNLHGPPAGPQQFHNPGMRPGGVAGLAGGRGVGGVRPAGLHAPQLQQGQAQPFRNGAPGPAGLHQQVAAPRGRGQPVNHRPGQPMPPPQAHPGITGPAPRGGPVPNVQPVSQESNHNPRAQLSGSGNGPHRVVSGGRPLVVSSGATTASIPSNASRASSNNLASSIPSAGLARNRPILDGYTPSEGPVPDNRPASLSSQTEIQQPPSAGSPSAPRAINAGLHLAPSTPPRAQAYPGAPSTPLISSQPKLNIMDAGFSHRPVIPGTINMAASPPMIGEVGGYGSPSRRRISGLVDDPQMAPEDLFERLEKLGEGAFGTVYKAQKRDTGEIVAIKIVPIDDAKVYDKLAKELAILRQCESTFIVGYSGAYVSGSDLWIAMEYCDGGSAWDLVTLCKHHLQETEVAAILRDIVHGLAYIHSLRKIHRDVKAGNVLLMSNGQAKLADFGVSSTLEGGLERRRTIIGTPFWMAPEIIQETGYNEKADIWSLGITAIELAEGKPPLSDIHPMRVIFQIPSRDPPTLASTNAWSQTFHDFVNCCLQKVPERRPTAKSLLDHPFIKKARSSRAVLAALVDSTRDKLAEARAQADALNSSQPLPSVGSITGQAGGPGPGQRAHIGPGGSAEAQVEEPARAVQSAGDNSRRSFDFVNPPNIAELKSLYYSMTYAQLVVEYDNLGTDYATAMQRLTEHYNAHERVLTSAMDAVTHDHRPNVAP